jgi:uncharacterized protein YceH (UPF0502 family)
MLRRLGIVLSIAVLLVLMLQTDTAAQSSANLQADIFDLRSQVSQLRAEVAQLRRLPGGSQIPRDPVSQRIPRSPTPTDSQIVDRLAILAIEAKDRLNALETRVSRLEKRIQ